MSEFKIGDKVKLVEPIMFNGGHIPKGTFGTIKKVGRKYLEINWDDRASSRRVPIVDVDFAKG